jgi:uncharacterized protein
MGASEVVMLRLLQQHRRALGDLCERYGVARLEVFGSAARGDFDPARSDLDFLVSFQRRADLDRFVQYFGLKEDLEALFGRHIDLVMMEALRNPYFIEGVNESRVLLYAA